MNGSPLPPLGWGSLATVHFSVLALVFLVAAALYGLAAQRCPWPWRRTAAFMAGMGVALMAVGSVVGRYESVLFYMHMIQHLMLIMVAAPLIALGAPVTLVREALRGRPGRLADAVLESPAAHFFGHPLVDFALYACLIPVFHLTSAFDFTLMHPLACDAEHVYFLTVGYLFWRHVVAVEPARHPVQGTLRVFYLLLAAPVDTFTGLALLSASHQLYPSYAMVMRQWGPLGLADIHIGGAVMLLGGNGLTLTAVALVATIAARRPGPAGAPEASAHHPALFL